MEVAVIHTIVLVPTISRDTNGRSQFENIAHKDSFAKILRLILQILGFKL